MKTLLVIAPFVLLVVLAGCQSQFNNTAPAITPAVASAKNNSSLNMATLERGRTVFASRCIECHVLPAIPNYPAERWPRIVHWMSDRAALKPADQEAVIAYILAARKQSDNGKEENCKRSTSNWRPLN